MKPATLKKTKSGGSLGGFPGFYKPYGYSPKGGQREEDTRHVRPYELKK